MTDEGTPDLEAVSAANTSAPVPVRQTNQAQEAREAMVFELLREPGTGVDLDAHLDAVKQTPGLSPVVLGAIYRQQEWREIKRGAVSDAIFDAITWCTNEVREYRERRRR